MKCQGYLFACDLDGTLLNSQKDVSLKNREAISYFRRNGGLFVACTGRVRDNFLQIGKNIELLDYFEDVAVVGNGCQLYDIRTGETLFRNEIPAAETRSLIREIHELYPQFGVMTAHDDGSHHFPERSDAMGFARTQGEYPMNTSFLKPEQETEDCVKMSFDGKAEELAELFRILDERHPGRYNGMLTYSDHGEMSLKDSDKAKGVLRAAEYYHIPKDHIITMGDDGNDVGMIREGHISFAPCSSKKEVLEVADHIVSSCDEDAVSEAIRILDGLL